MSLTLDELAALADRLSKQGGEVFQFVGIDRTFELSVESADTAAMKRLSVWFRAPYQVMRGIRIVVAVNSVKEFAKALANELPARVRGLVAAR